MSLLSRGCPLSSVPRRELWTSVVNHYQHEEGRKVEADRERTQEPKTETGKRGQARTKLFVLEPQREARAT